MHLKSQAWDQWDFTEETVSEKSFDFNNLITQVVK